MTTLATRSGPSAPTALFTVYRLFLRGQLTRLRALGLLSLGLVGVLLAAVSRSSDDVVDTGTTLLAEYGLGVVAPVCTLWIGASLLGDLVEDQLLAYVWLKPIGRWVFPTAAVLACLTILIPLAVVPLAIAALVTGVDDLVVPTIVATVLAVTAYSGLFVTLGARFSRALWWGLLYILIWENAIARIADGTARLAVRSYSVSILSRATDVDMPLADRSATASVVVPIAIAIAAIAISTWILARRDID